MFKKKKENPFFNKLKKINRREHIAGKIIRAFYLGGFVYTSENYTNAIEAISKNRLSDFLEKTPYNIHENNVQLYLIEDQSKQYKIIIILDPVELFENENIINIIYDNSIDYNIYEQIYP